MIQLTKDSVFTIVCNIRTPQDDGSEVIGTGIFIEKDNKAYLITADHVSKKTNSNSYIIYCDKNNTPFKRKLVKLNSSLSWISHSIEDISILELDVLNNMDLLSERCFPYDQIEDDISKISRDDELTSVGFPNGLGAVGKFSPFTFRSYASSSEISFTRFDIPKIANFICLENPSVGGYSGGPILDLGIMHVGVMTSSTGPTRLIGIMHGTMIDNTGGKIAVFSPAKYIKDLI